ncbi:MAG: hypothetical protein HKN32_06615 [Flavobacteriales bacterium]|nr:hypothetical protein [Flavobacteriales bacterium]
MKVSFLIVLVVFGLTAIAQDDPETAIVVEHRWSNGEYVQIDFNTATDSPESVAEGPDIWLQFVATRPDLVLHLSNAWADSYAPQLEDQAGNILPPSGFSAGIEWENLQVGSSYLLSLTQGLVETSEDGFECVALTDDNYSCPGDFDLNGGAFADDILGFLVQWGQTGQLDQDFDMDGLVSALDLISFLAVFGQVCWGPCD